MNRAIGHLAGVVFSLACATVSATTIPGGNIINQTWTLAGSPYIVQGDITIPAGAFLVIQAGVTVLVTDFDSQASGLNTSKVEITANGSLTIQAGATLGAQTTPTAGDWYGIVVNSGASASLSGTVQHTLNGVTVHAVGVTIDNLTVTHVTNCGLTLASNGGNAVSATNLTFTNVLNGICSDAGNSSVGASIVGVTATNVTGWAVRFTQGFNELQRARLTNVANGVYVGSAVAQVNIKSSLITGNGSGTGYGVQRVAPSSSGPLIVLSYVTIDGFDTGATSWPYGSLTVGNSILTNNTSYGLLANDNAQYYYSNAWGNGANVFGFFAFQSSNISADPLYANRPGGDFHLTPASPSANAASNISPLSVDLDGNPRPYGYVYDMGAFELQEKAYQRLTFGPLADRLYNDPPFDVSASSNSTLAVSVTSLTTSICTISGNTVTLTGSNGTCTLVASQAGDTYYFAAEDTESFLVSGAPSVAPRSGFNGDARSDVLWRNTSTGQIYEWQMNGLAISGQGYLPSVPTNWAAVAVGDASGDGNADVFWREATGLNYLWIVNGLGIGSQGYLPTVANPWIVVGMGDASGDGKADVFWRNPTSGQNYLWILNGLSITSQGYLPSVAGPDWEAVGVADYSGDGKADVLWRNKTTGQNYLWIVNGLVIASQGYLPSVVPVDWEVAGSPDANGDVKADVLWRHKTSGQNYLWLMNGLAVSSQGYLPSVAGTDWKVVGFGDYNGDGRGDVLWRNATSGLNYLWTLNGMNVTTQGYLPSVSGSSWVPVK